jgi:hypothetical protein
MTNQQKILISKLSWNASIDAQQEAIQSIVKDPSFLPSLLVQPLDKSCWENAALALKLLGFEKVKALTYSLLMWLQDINWPGTFTIIELLETFPNKILMPYYERAISDAINSNDESWLEFLSVLTYNGKITLKEFSNPELYQVMKAHEDQWNVDPQPL